MIPKASKGIANLAARIGEGLAAQAGDAYLATDLRLSAALISMIAQDYDRAADVLIAEHAPVVELLRQSLPHIADEGLADQVRQAIAFELRSHRVADLNERADQIMKALIKVHEAADRANERHEPWAHAFNLQIWSFLERWSAARAYQI